MSGQEIAIEAHEGLIEAASDTGLGRQYTATLIRSAPETGPDAGTPWGEAATGNPLPPETYEIVIVDLGIKTEYARSPDGSSIARRAHRLLVSAVTEKPMVGDNIKFPGDEKEHEILEAKAINTGGVDLLFKVEIKI